MQTPPTDESKLTFEGMTAQARMYLARIAAFPTNWGLSDPGTKTPDMRPRLFRYDAKRLKRMVASAEHMIRCLIIWLAYRKMRDETVTPRPSPFPVAPDRTAPRRPFEPAHPQFVLRGLPLFEPKPPPFRISMPAPRSDKTDAADPYGPTRRHARSRSRFRSRTRPRNDDVSQQETLYLRLERLGALFDQLDVRADRLAARWAGWLGEPAGADNAESPAPEKPRIYGEARSWRGGVTAMIRPLKSHDPPPDLIFDAPDDEIEDLHILHDAAIRTAEGFPALCG